MNLRNAAPVLLFLSVAINLGLVGFMMSRHHEKPMPPYIRLEKQLRTLPQPERGKVEAILSKYHPEIVKQFRTVETTREQLRLSINAPDYSRQKTSRLFDDMQQAYSKMGEASQAMILDVNDELTAEQRARFDPIPPMKKR